jgi:beta-glucosidase
MDAGITPQYPFGYGLSYTQFSYADISVSQNEVPMGGKFTVQAEVTNAGDVAADEIVQLYVRDLVGNVTRPVRELKGFTRVHLKPGESRQVAFELDTSDLAFYGRQMQRITEPGEFHAWIGGSSEASLQVGFSIVDN